MALRPLHSAPERQKHHQPRRGGESWLRLRAPERASSAHQQPRHKKQPWSQRCWWPGWDSAGSQATSLRGVSLLMRRKVAVGRVWRKKKKGSGRRQESGGREPRRSTWISPFGAAEKGGGGGGFVREDSKVVCRLKKRSGSECWARWLYARLVRSGLAEEISWNERRGRQERDRWDPARIEARWATADQERRRKRAEEGRASGSADAEEKSNGNGWQEGAW